MHKTNIHSNYAHLYILLHSLLKNKANSSFLFLILFIFWWYITSDLVCVMFPKLILLGVTPTNNQCFSTLDFFLRLLQGKVCKAVLAALCFPLNFLGVSSFHVKLIGFPTVGLHCCPLIFSVKQANNLSLPEFLKCNPRLVKPSLVRFMFITEVWLFPGKYCSVTVQSSCLIDNWWFTQIVSMWSAHKYDGVPIFQQVMNIICSSPVYKCIIYT